jgi:hypothetical protein
MLGHGVAYISYHVIYDCICKVWPSLVAMPAWQARDGPHSMMPTGETVAAIPQSIVSELADWNDGAGIDLVDWTANTGSFSLAVGYSEVFWPRFTEFENYVLMESFSLAALRSFESLPQITRQSIERVMNHLHIADIQHGACTDIAADKLIFLGHRLREIYAAKLALDFPDRKFLVEFYCPEQSQDFEDYQLSFFRP